MEVIILLVSLFACWEVVRRWWANRSLGCGSRFVDVVKGYHIMAGYDNLIFGAAVPGLGKDGIMAGDARLTAKSDGEEKKVESEKMCPAVDGMLGDVAP
jgi:hypothetical protein